MNITRQLLLSAVAVAMSAAAFAASPPSPQVVAVRDRWASVNYDVPKAQREAQFDALAKQAATVRKAAPSDPNAMIWEGIVLSSLAGERGGLGALGLAKQARADFEAAIRVDPTALDGSAYTSLGVLYYSVPGWPVGFGDDDKARDLLLKGLKVNPDGIDANYFYGDFLRDQGDYAAAARALEKALAAPPRPGREVADRGRRAEATAMLRQVKAKLAAR